MRILAVVLAALTATPALAQPAPARPTDAAGLGQEAVALLREYLHIDTTNPPGNEERAVAFLGRILKAEGIPYETAASAPGRGNIWARLKGGSAPALVLLHHMDVVPADRRHWDVDPFAATERDGVLFGRGALDTKTLGILQLEAFLALHRLGLPLERDVIFMATADEEAGGSFGAGWVVANHPEAFKGAGLLLNEGGGGTLTDGRARFGIEVTQKTPLWLRLTATDEPSHGSTPHVASSVTRLVRALYRLQTYHFQPRIVPAVDAYFKALAPAAAPRWRGAFEDIGAAVKNPVTLLSLQSEDPGLAALTRNTCSITRLEGSGKINVVPAEAHAELDCRLLPDQDQAAFLAELGGVLNDPAIQVDTIMRFTPAVTSTETPLYRAIVEALRRHFPDATIAPAVETGFTDSHFFRDLGIACYGFAPVLIPSDQESGVHGNNERISIENVTRGTAVMLEIVREVAAGQGAR